MFKQLYYVVRYSTHLEIYFKISNNLLDFNNFYLALNNFTDEIDDEIVNPFVLSPALVVIECFFYNISNKV